MSIPRIAASLTASGIVAWALCLGAPLATGASFVEKNFDQLVGEAEDILVGTVESTVSRRTASGVIVTDVTLSVWTTVKGPATQRFVLQVLGGSVGSETLEVVGLPQFHVGQTYLLFSKENGRVILPLVGGDQGVFQIGRDGRTGEALVFNANGQPVRVWTAGSRLEFGSAGGTPATLGSLLSEIRARLGR